MDAPLQRHAEVTKTRLPAAGEVVTECAADAAAVEKSKTCGTESVPHFLRFLWMYETSLDLTCVLEYDG